MKLKNCPWCGGSAMTVTFKDSKKCYVTCMENDTCKALPQTKMHESRDSAISAWNEIPDFRKIMIETMVNEETWKAIYPNRELWT